MTHDEFMHLEVKSILISTKGTVIQTLDLPEDVDFFGENCWALTLFETDSLSGLKNWPISKISKRYFDPESWEKL